MTQNYEIAVLPGDGIGPEVVGCALAVLDAAEARFGFTTSRTAISAGATQYLATGELFDGTVWTKSRTDCGNSRSRRNKESRLSAK